MNSRKCLWMLALAAALGCSCAPGARGPVIRGATPPPRDARPDAAQAVLPLFVDRDDLGLGTTVYFDRIPTAGELHDLEYTNGLAHAVLSLPAWPETFEAIRSLNLRPIDLDVIVLLPGYPPSREAVQAWNEVHSPLRLVMLVDGPPGDRSVISDLNALRALDRIIVTTDQPSRLGFERLQRPLSYRRVIP